MEFVFCLRPLLAYPGNGTEIMQGGFSTRAGYQYSASRQPDRSRNQDLQNLRHGHQTISAWCCSKVWRNQGLLAMLDRGEDVNVSDPPTSAHHRTALHWAAFSNNEAVIELLVEAGASVQAVGKGGESPLHVSVERRALQAARALVRHGADANATDALRRTPLHRVASTQGTVDMAKLLLDSGSDAKMPDADGHTAGDVVGADVPKHSRSTRDMDVLRQLLALTPVIRDDSA